MDRLKIIDFGLAKELGLYADRIPITMCGTLEFMSPEVMKCSHASPASDLWSVGVVLYMMLSGGVSPFWAGSEYRTQRKIMRGIYDLEHPNFKVRVPKKGPFRLRDSTMPYQPHDNLITF